MGSSIDLKKFIKTEAYRLGFSHIGFTSPLAPDLTPNYLTWIDNKLHADMNYLDRQDRLEKIKDPLKILPSCQTIVVFALPYLPAEWNNKPKDNIGQIASYAVGQDYHIVIPNLLNQIVEKIIANYPGLDFEYKMYTDTGPILEKAFAQKAGLGWIGKNGCLIIPGFGSYVLLAELLINQELSYDPPFTEDYCGNCQACLDACPTQCILKNRTLNAVDCISYQTIENKSNIPEKNRASHGNWVFGCDICQIVCPWNRRFAEKPAHRHFTPIDQFPSINLETLSLLSPQEFNKKFKNHPIKRAKRRGYYRNLCVVIGNTKSKKYLPFLKDLILRESDPIIINHATWAIQQIELS
ncbi:MAG: tRNA epoxyqueuosine(34) reductase QueG [Anaerolineaceae bacterium]|nr:tRNA epoxyqueuosine(34) reductase QueG [Anaerolineaceae bacterium]